MGLGALVAWHRPTEVLFGALVGAAVRTLSGDGTARPFETESEKRAMRVRMLCLNSTAALASVKTSNAATPWLAGYTGMQAFSNGVYPMLRKVLG